MATSSSLCNSCGSDNPAQAIFCMTCGALMDARTANPRNLTGLLQQDQLLKQRYRILTQVGRGGFAAVYKAEDLQFRQRPVAIKEMSQSGLEPQELAESVEAFKREAQLLASLQHPNLPRIYDHFSEGGRWYLVMDFIEGETLEGYFLQRPYHRLSLKEALAVGLQLCSVLDYLHTRQPPVIFRDLKPANILRAPTGHLYLIDFGIARHFKIGQIKDTIPFGSPGYAAPEQYGKAQTTQQSDIYSLGVLLHQMLSGEDPSERPFVLSPLRLYGTEGMAELEALIARMTNLDPGQRPASVAEVQAELQHIARLDPTARTYSRPEGHRRDQASTKAEEWSSSGEYSMARQEQVQRPRTSLPRRKFIIGGALAIGTGSLLALLLEGGKKSAPVVPAKRMMSEQPLPQMPSQLATPAQGVAPTQIPDAPQRLFVYRGHVNTPWPRPVLSIAWSPQGNVIASADDNSTVQVWQADNGKPLYLVDITYVHALSWSPDGKFLAAVDVLDGGGSVRSWDPFSQQYAFSYPVDSNGCWSVAYSPDGNSIAVGSYSGVKVLNVTDGQVIFKDYSSYIGIASQVRTVAWAGDSSALSWAGAYFQELKVWQRNTGTTLSYPVNSQVTSTAWSPDGTLVAAGTRVGPVIIWNAASRQKVLTYLGHVDYVDTLSWSPDGKYIASAGGDSTVRVWNPATGETLTVYQGHVGAVNSISWSPDSTRIASGGVDQTVQVWKAL